MRGLEWAAALAVIIGLAAMPGFLDSWRGAFATLALVGAVVSGTGLLHALGIAPPALRDARWQHTLDRLIARKPAPRAGGERLPRPDAIALDALAGRLQQDIVGQRRVCGDLADQLRVRFAKTQRQRPVAIFALVAPPHSGKRWLAQCIDRALHGTSATCEIDLRQCAPPLDTALFGEPRSLTSPGRCGELAAALSQRAARVVVLRGLEHADASTASWLLRCWTRGHFVDGFSGKPVSARDAIFFVMLDGPVVDTAISLRSAADDRDAVSAHCGAVLQVLLPKWLHERIERFIPLEPLDMDELAQIAAARLKRMLAEFGLELEAADLTLIRGALDAARPAPRTPHEAAQLLLQQLEQQSATLQRRGMRRVRIAADADDLLQLIPA